MKEREWGGGFTDANPRQIALPLGNNPDVEKRGDRVYKLPEKGFCSQGALLYKSVCFDSFFNHPDMLLCLFDEEGRVILWNKTLERVSGYTFEAVQGSRRWLSLLYPNIETRQRLLSSLHVFADMKGASVSCETKMRGRDGETATVLWSCTTVSFASGLSGILCSGVDVTARSNRERKLAERLSTLTELFNTMGDAAFFHEIVNKNTPGLFLEVNEGACRMLGYSREELLSLSPLAIEGELRREGINHVISSLFQKGQVVFQTQLRKKDGTFIPVEICAHLFCLRGKPAILSIARDSTERKQAEEALRDSEAFSRRILAQNPNPIFVVGPDTRIQYVNEAFEHVFGYSSEDVLERPAPYPWWRSDYWLNMGELRLAIHEGMTRKEKLSIRKDGEEIWGEVTAVPIRERDGCLKYCVLSWNDITARKKLEEQIRLNQHQLQFLTSELYVAEERERRRIATDLHDGVGQNLALIRIKLEMLSSYNSYSSSSKDIFQEILALLDRSIVEMRTLIFDLSPPMLYELSFHSAVEWLIEKMGDEHGLCIVFKDLLMSDDIAMDIKIFLFRALRELLMNVVKHARTSEVSVCLSRFDRWTVALEVRDNGVGFDLSSLRELGRDPSNFGLLNIQERVNYIGGFMQIESSPGQGTDVTLFVPVESEEERAGDFIEKSEDSVG
ncbi:PAS domain-containing sensor histidine kinase [Aminobacterium mobile]|uniref:PAS domain-containing sensor histidine kinase n=1 Tax=Aminobacterium mobile TaxID=81467 RepID=UPI003315AC47